MSTIKKIAVLVSIVWISLSSVFAESESGHYGLSLSPMAGILFGQGEEFLFKYRNRDNYVSELLWDLKPLAYTGFSVDFGPADPFKDSGFYLAASAKFGIPHKTGIIEDRDWQYDDNENLTNYSRHDAYSQSAILADFSAGYSLRLARFLSIRAYGNFSYMRFSWLAKDGYLQYLESKGGAIIPDQIWDSSIPKIFVYGPGIQYTQTWTSISPALSVMGKINDLFSIEGNIRYTPLVYCKDRDDHFVPDANYNGRTFLGDFSYGHFIDGSGRFIFSPAKNTDLLLTVNYRYITGLRGENYVDINYAGANAGQSFRNFYDGGVGYSTLDIGLAVRFLINL